MPSRSCNIGQHVVLVPPLFIAHKCTRSSELPPILSFNSCSSCVFDGIYCFITFSKQFMYDSKLTCIWFRMFFHYAYVYLRQLTALLTSANQCPFMAIPKMAMDPAEME